MNLSCGGATRDTVKSICCVDCLNNAFVPVIVTLLVNCLFNAATVFSTHQSCSANGIEEQEQEEKTLRCTALTKTQK